jgi:hypothetical protein
MSNYPENWEKDITPREILLKDELVQVPIIGNTYHISWARNKGMCWKLLSFDDNYAYLRTPKTHKPIKCKLSELREIASRARNKAYHREHKS